MVRGSSVKVSGERGFNASIPFTSENAVEPQRDAGSFLGEGGLWKGGRLRCRFGLCALLSANRSQLRQVLLHQVFFRQQTTRGLLNPERAFLKPFDQVGGVERHDAASCSNFKPSRKSRFLSR